MKKFLISLVIVIGAVAVLPIVGNSVSDKFLDERVTLLVSNGLEVSNESAESSYLNSKKHYEFLLSDAPKFIEYINQYSESQIPPYVDAMIEGVAVGVDIEYSNFPLSSKVMVDIYPLSFSADMMDELKLEDIKFYTYLDNLLKSKAILYHINYDISDELFDGFIKNIDELYTFNNGTKAKFKIFDATYYGQGPLIAPQNLHSNISEIAIHLDTSDEDIIFKLHDLSSAFTFESQSTYVSSANIKAISLFIENIKSAKTEINIDDMKLNISSNTQGNKAEFYAKSSLSKLKINSQEANIVASGFNYDISLDGIDKDSYEEFRKLTSHANSRHSLKFEQEFEDSITKLLSKGLTLSIPDLSLSKIGVENKKPIDGFSMMSKLTLAKDLDLAKKFKTSPMAVINNFLITSTLKFSKDFYALLNKELPSTTLANEFAREDAKSIIFDIELKNGHLSVNGKAII